MYLNIKQDDDSGSKVHLSSYLTGTNTWATYLQKMLIPSNWGTHLELASFAEMFGVDVLIITSSITNNQIWLNPKIYKSSSIVLLGFIPEYHYYSLKGIALKCPCIIYISLTILACGQFPIIL